VKISELMKQLDAIKKQYGDVQVRTGDDGFDAIVQRARIVTDPAYVLAAGGNPFVNLWIDSGPYCRECRRGCD
jgi:hypothetical protein